MTRPESFADRVRRAFEPTPRGAADLVDGLLGLCRGERLRVDHRDGHCRVSRPDMASRGVVDVPLPAAVVRAALARVAALCNERNPGSVTPYRGDGEITLWADPPAAFRVTFVNTPGEQWLEAEAVADSPAPAYHQRAEPCRS